MKKERLADALDRVEDRFIAEAAEPKALPHPYSAGKIFRLALAACLILALGICAAAAGLLQPRVRRGEPGETQEVEFPGGIKVTWDANLVMEFDDMEECPRVLIRPGWFPSDHPRRGYEDDKDGWVRALTSEYDDLNAGRGVTCQVQVYYACRFAGGGALLLSYSEPVQVHREEWESRPGWEIWEITSESRRGGGHDEYYYLVMFQPEDGTIVVIRGQSDMETMEHVARELEIKKTGETAKASDFDPHYAFFDVGVG